MTNHMDDRITAVLDAEGDRADVDPTWPLVERRIARARRTRRMRRGGAAILAAAAACAAAVAVARPFDDNGGGYVDITTPDPAPTTTTVLDPSDPIGSQPGPAPLRDAPPERLVVVTEDGKLAVVDRKTGDLVRELVDLDDHFNWGVDSIEHVALSPDGRTVWFDTCCIADGTFSVPIDGSEPPISWGGYGHRPTFASSNAWVATVVRDFDVGAESITTPAVVLNFPNGDWGRFWEQGWRANPYQEVAWSFDGRHLVVREGVETGELMVLDPSLMGGVEAADSVVVEQQEPVALPGDAWRTPTFRRDGRLVAASIEANGTWTGRVIDLDGTPTVTDETFELDGEPLSLDHDQSGEWLLTVVREPGDPAGTLGWRGPDGQTGVIPGNYYAAAW